MYSVRILATLAVVTALHFTGSIFIPIIVGIFLFFLLDPLVKRGEKKNVPRSVSAIFLVFTSAVISGLLIWVLYGAVAEIAREVPAYSKKIMGIVTELQKKAETLSSNLNSLPTPVKQESESHGDDPSTSIPATEPSMQHAEIQKVQVVGGEVEKLTSFALSGVGTLFSLFATALFIPLIALFLLLEKKILARSTTDLFRNILETTRIDSEIHRMLKAFFVGNFITGSVISIILIILFSVLGLRNSVSLGLISGFLILIPLIGPLVALPLPLAAGLLQFSTPTPFIVISGTVILLHFITGNLIMPKYVGGHVNLNTFASTISLLFWGWLWGAIGVLLAIPLTALLRIFLENYAPTVRLSKVLAGTAKK